MRRGPVRSDVDPVSKTGHAGTGSVQSLTRAISLLEILSEGGCRLKDLAARAGLPASTTHRLLTTLEQKRIVRFDREEFLWDIGSNCYSIGAGYLRRKRFVSETSPRIDALARRINATASLGLLEEGKILLVRQTKHLTASPANPPGSLLPAHATAMGKVLLAAAGPANLGGSSDLGDLARLTDNTICDPASLAEELRSVRQEGFAVDKEESMQGRRCIAAPIHDEFGNCIAALSLTDTSSQLADTAIAQLGFEVAATAAEITLASGGHLPAR